MSTFSRLLYPFQDSPNFGRDRANLLSGATIGFAGLMLNLVVMVLVSPFMLNPNGSDFRRLTENIEFGQLLALILLGGTTVFATLLIPLRMATVFWGPRIGRYFDQIVLSGISPFRFMIGKATSQNLFLGLIAFLLLPYFVLSMSLGGVDLGFFAAGLFLIWLYCMALALVTLWISLYFNELIAAIVVIAGAGMMVGLGTLPIPYQPFALSPAPLLLHPFHETMQMTMGPFTLPGLVTKFLTSAIGLIVVIGLATLGIYLGPLYGIIRENSTFGEVVRRGDSKRKKWFRFRHHIQRPSELAFFYENRSDKPLRNEGLMRWVVGVVGITLLFGTAYGVFLMFLSTVTSLQGPGRWNFTPEFHFTHLIFLGVGLVIAAFLFSHPKNTTLMDVTFMRGKTDRVSRLDTISFLSFATIATVFAIGFPHFFEHLFAGNGKTIFTDFRSRNSIVDYAHFSLEAPIILLVSGLVIYALHRYACLCFWMKSFAFGTVAFLYLILVCVLPLFLAVLYHEQVRELRNIALFNAWAPHIAMISPMTWFPVSLNEFRNFGDAGNRATSASFYAFHGVLLLATCFAIRRRTRMLEQTYLSPIEEAMQ